tara:strand:- start:40 stop:1224 length:1185 start_codon:yes stop_codon:yes gene_type:complete
MFGVVSGHCNRYLDFNGGAVYLWTNPEQKPDGVNLATDVSFSMECRLSELKLIRSMFFAVFNVQHRHPIEIGGQTSIADAVKKLSVLMGPEEKLVVVTDGDDTASTSWKFESALPVPHDPTSTAYPEYYEDYKGRKRASLLDYIEQTSNAEIFLVGVGEEVKDFLAVATRPGRRMQVAHIPDGADAKTVATVIKTGLKAPKRGADAPYEIISIDAPTTSLVEATEEEEAAVSNVAATLSVDGFSMSVEQLKKSIEDAETSVNSQDVDLKYARACLLWFFTEILKVNKPLPGALLGGKYNHVFADSGAIGKKTNLHVHLNKMCSLLKGCVLKQYAKGIISVTIEGTCFNYTDVCGYMAIKLDQNVVDAAIADVDWVAPQSALVRAAVRGSKRERE